MNVFFHTFGCKVNCFETAAMESVLAESGFTAADGLHDADLVVVNSCTVTAGGDRKARRFLARAKRENPDAVTMLTGCFPQAFPDDASRVAEADIVTGNRSRNGIAELFFRYLDSRTRIVEITPHRKGDAFEQIPVDVLPGHTRAFLKAEDGCDRHCSYCAVPRARGFVRSLPPEQISAQAARFAAAGYREIVLTGINLSSYGRGDGKDLADAARAASAPEGIVRVRLSSLEPDQMTEALLDRLAVLPKLCRQFHLSLQSGCARTLAAMGRRYTPSEYLSSAEHIRARFPRPTFTTDIIAGFPGETEGDFEESAAFVRAFGFLKCHVFPYSPRPGTPAAAMEQLPRAAREARARRMIEAAGQTRRAVLEQQIGHTARVILEQRDSLGRYSGYSGRYIPVRLEDRPSLDGGLNPGDLIDCVITGAEQDCCVAERAAMPPFPFRTAPRRPPRR